jgi:hypothetical protein
VLRGRDGGYWLRPGAGDGDGGSGPRQCAAALEVAGQAARHQRRDSPATSAANARSLVCPTPSLGDRSRCAWNLAGAVRVARRRGALEAAGKGVTDRRLRSAGLHERSLRMPLGHVLGTSRSTYYARRRSGSPRLPPPHLTADIALRQRPAIVTLRDYCSRARANRAPIMLGSQRSSVGSASSADRPLCASPFRCSMGCELTAAWRGRRGPSRTPPIRRGSISGAGTSFAATAPEEPG